MSAPWTASREGPNFPAIDPDECIDCAVCIPECPVNAIVPGGRRAGDQQHMIKINADLSKVALHHQAQGRPA